MRQQPTTIKSKTSWSTKDEEKRPNVLRFVLPFLFVNLKNFVTFYKISKRHEELYIFESQFHKIKSVLVKRVVANQNTHKGVCEMIFSPKSNVSKKPASKSLWS